MRHAQVTIRTLTLAQLVDSAFEAKLYVEAPGDDGVTRRPKMLEIEKARGEKKGGAARVPALQLEAVQDRSGVTLVLVTANGDDAVAWARDFAELDSAAQTAAQRQRKFERDIEERARAERNEIADELAAAPAAPIVPTQLSAGDKPPGFTETPSVQVYLTPPSPGVPVEDVGLDDFEEPPTPPATPPAKRKSRRS